MDPKTLLDLLGEVIPVGIVALVAVGLYFMKGHQDNMEKLYKLTIDQQTISEGRHRDFRQTLQEQCDDRISFLQKHIDRLSNEHQNLRTEVAEGKDDYRDLQDKYLTLQAKVDSMLKERFDERNSARDIVSKLEEGVDQLSDRDKNEIIKLKQDVTNLKMSLEQMEKVDEATRDWLQDIRTYSRNRTSLAQRAAQHARQDSSFH